MELLYKLRALFRKDKLDREMSDELLHHLDLQAEANLTAGMKPDEARFAAQRQFGGLEQIKERARDQRGWRWIEELTQDLRYAVRALRKNPGFTITAVLTLALGIGVNTAMFTAYDAVALRALPVREPDALIKIVGETGLGRYHQPGFSYPEYLDYRDSNHVLSGLAAANEASIDLHDDTSDDFDPLFSVRGPGTVIVQFVSDNYFTVLGAGMKLGRGFRPDENRAPGAAPVIVLSYPFWEEHLHRDPDILGKTISLGRNVYTIIGVTSEEFVGHVPAPPAGWIPLMMWATPSTFMKRNVQAFRLIGRMLPGVTQEQAKADLDLIAGRLAKLYPSNDAKTATRLERGMKFVTIPVNARWLVAMAPVLLGFGMVLVIACTNVANLLLARGITRQPEIGVRLTLGASRGRVIRQLLTENFLLCFIAAVAGLVFALWTLQILRPIILAELPVHWSTEARPFQFVTLSLDHRIVVFAVLLALVAALVAGLVPALHATRLDLFSAMKNEGTIFGRRLSHSRLRNFLLISQVAVCLTLLSCAGLFARNLSQLQNLDVGFDPQRLYRCFVNPKSLLTGGVTPEVFRRRTAETLRTFPQVTSACQTFLGPLIGGTGITTPLKAVGTTGRLADVNFAFVSPEFFDTFGIPLRNGRMFSRPEVDANLRVVVISETLARRFWPGEDAVGKTVAVGEAAFTFPSRAKLADFRDYQVIGVARDVHLSVWDTAQTLIYLPLAAEVAANSRDVCIRLNTNSRASFDEISRRADAAGFTILDYGSLEEELDSEKLPFRGVAVLSGALGTLALLMASIGLYGAMSFSVNQRVREIGIRVALGASAEKVVRLFLREGLRMIVIGIAFGLAGGALFALLLRKIMFGLAGALDPIAFGAVTVILTLIALLACWLPARRATKVDPMVALRCE